jgi:hypothetical protein
LYLLTGLLALSFCFNTDAVAGRLVDIEAASIQYKTSTAVKVAGIKSSSSGVEKLYLKSWGQVQKTEETTNVSDILGKRVEREMTLLDKGTVYTVDYESRVISKIPVEALGAVSPEEYATYTENWRDSLRNMNAKKTGSESILGYPCEIWEMPQLGSKLWIYKGLMLKSSTRMGGVVATSTAVDVKIGTPPDSAFALPKFPVMEGDASLMSSDDEMGMPEGYSDEAAPSDAELQQAAEAMKKLMQSLGGGAQ